MFSLKGCVAVITGASSGLGYQMAKGFAVIVNENPAKKGKKIHHFWIKKLFTSF